jgi:hypothetical protein
MFLLAPSTTPRPGVPMQGLVDALSELALEAGNTPAKAQMHIPTDLLNAYLSWVDFAERRLANMLTRSEIEDLLLTRRHWSLRAMDGGSAGLASAVRLEVEQRKAAVEALRDELASFQQHWEARSGVVAVPDTNVFLDVAQPIDALPWADMVGIDTDVHIVIPLLVVDELDKNKRHNNKNLQQAARHSLRWLESMRGGSGPDAPRVGTASLEILADPPGHVRGDDADYEILDRVALLKHLTALRVCVVTQDLGMRVRAESLGLEALAAPQVPQAQ